MARPLKTISAETLQRNGSLTKEHSSFILRVAMEAAAQQTSRIPSHDRRYMKQEITSAIITSLLTSSTYDPHRGPEATARYIRRSAKMKANTILRFYMKAITRFVEADKYIK